MRKKVNLILGMFDGVHKGHQALLQRAKQLCPVCPSAVFTFANSPAAFFGKPVPLLTLPEEKEALLRGKGADLVVLAAFDDTIAQMPPEEYIQYLLKLFPVRNIIVGFNHVFGKNAAGNGELLQKLGEKYGFSVQIVPPVETKNGAAISSTRIREALGAGNIKEANAMLGYDFFVQGTVVSGRRIGSSIGFPTANIAVDTRKILPKDGVYITKAAVDGLEYRAVTNIGVNPTVNGEKRTVETHLLGVDKELYQKHMRIAFCQRIRGEQKFPSKDSLAAQIQKDKLTAEDYFKKIKE